MMLVFVLLRRGAPVLRVFTGFWKEGLLGGALSLASYWIAIWAMTVAPIALVAALRETSVLFAAAIGHWRPSRPPTSGLGQLRARGQRRAPVELAPWEGAAGV
jgi:hypothetical protein